MLSVVLWGVENPGNLGAIARLCKNFGVSELVLVEPLCSKDDEAARNRAKHAQDVLAGARVIAPDEIESSFDVLVGTTAQVGTEFNIPRSPLMPREFAKRARADVHIGLVFGRESSGLTNEEIARCDFTVTIPASEAYATLNLSHAVAILLYEVFASDAEPVHEVVPRVELDKMIEFVDAIIDGFEFATEEKRETQRIVWRRVLSKAMITRREAHALMGLFRKVLDVQAR